MPNGVRPLNWKSRWITSLILLGWISSAAVAEDFDGVQPAALDQPRVNLLIKLTPDGPPLTTTSFGQTSFNVQAFLDTGASGVLLSPNNASGLGITRETVGKAKIEARFEDVGVGGGSEFAISQPICLAIAPMSASVDIDNKDSISSTYTKQAGPLRAQIGPLATGLDYLESLVLGDLDIAGMPVMQGKIVVMDPRDVNTFSDTIRTYLYDANRPEDLAMVPKTSRHVRLSYVSFSRFTNTDPADADAPAMSDNPVIGPNPLHPGGDRTPPVVTVHNGKTFVGSWLLDTRAAASMISQRQAAALGVKYKPDTVGTSNPVLDGVPLKDQFTLSVGGIGGMKKSAGFFLDKLTLMTREGSPITYLHAPVLVADITVKDAKTELTLDGVFGMNFLVASARVDEGGLMPDIGQLTAGPFRWIVFDQPAGLLGLQ